MISVLVPVRNRAELLAECIASVEAQTFRDWELIVVDDGSDVPVQAPCQVIHTRKRGIAHARNVALEAANGEYVFILDSDDTITPECLEKLHSLIVETGADWVFSRLAYVRDGQRVGFPPVAVQDFPGFLASNQVPHGSSLIRRSFIGDTRYNEQYASAVDLAFKCELLLKHPRMAMCDEVLYLYRLHGEQQIGTPTQIACDCKIREQYATR